MSDSADNAKPTDDQVHHVGMKIRGGPRKVQGIQKSAQDAHSERERFEKEQDAAHTEENSGADEKPHPQMHPAIARMRGGPEKIKAISESSRKAQEARELHTKQEESGGAAEAEAKET